MRVFFLKEKTGYEIQGWLELRRVLFRSVLRGGRGQYGDCWIRLAPLPRGSGFVFEDKIVGGVIPRQYIPAVERGIVEAGSEERRVGKEGRSRWSPYH